LAHEAHGCIAGKLSSARHLHRLAVREKVIVQLLPSICVELGNGSDHNPIADGGRLAPERVAAAVDRLHQQKHRGARWGTPAPPRQACSGAIRSV
jgi:hypothetical protein